MADLKTLRNRIKGVNKTQKIVKAMKMVSASKLRRARMAAENAREFTSNIEVSFKAHAVQASSASDEKFFFLGNDSGEHLYVLITSDRGLCGGLNNNLVKHVLKEIEEKKQKGIDCKVLAIGKKGKDIISSKAPQHLFDQSEGFSSRAISYDVVQEFGNKIVEYIEEGKFASVSLVYPEFVSAISQQPTEKNIIGGFDAANDNADNLQYDYEPKAKDFLDSLAKYFIMSQINQAFYEVFASEQGARMSAMDNAVNNCNELLKKLSLVYNRTRQAKITTELVEIISAAESI